MFLSTECSPISAFVPVSYFTLHLQSTLWTGLRCQQVNNKCVVLVMVNDGLCFVIVSHVRIVRV